MNRDICEPIEVIDSHNLRFEYADFMIRQMRYTSEQMMEMYNDYALVFSPAYKRKMTETLIAQYNLLSEQASLRPTVDILSNYKRALHAALRCLQYMGHRNVCEL